MKIKPDTIQNIILEAADETDPAFANEIRRHGRDTKLFGKGASLDSLALVTLIAAVETRLRDQTDSDILLVNENAMSRRNSPFRTVGTLCDYICEILEKQ